jgi:hypothetical protein
MYPMSLTVQVITRALMADEKAVEPPSLTAFYFIHNFFHLVNVKEVVPVIGRYLETIFSVSLKESHLDKNKPWNLQLTFPRSFTWTRTS